MGSISGWGPKIPHAKWHRQEKEVNSAIYTTGMNLENIMLGKISQTQKDKYFMTSLIHGI